MSGLQSSPSGENINSGGPTRVNPISPAVSTANGESTPVNAFGCQVTPSLDVHVDNTPDEPHPSATTAMSLATTWNIDAQPPFGRKGLSTACQLCPSADDQIRPPPLWPTATKPCGPAVTSTE